MSVQVTDARADHARLHYNAREHLLLHLARNGAYGAEMADAAADQLRRMPFNTNWSTAHRAAVDLADKLAELAPPGLDHVFFTAAALSRSRRPGSLRASTTWPTASRSAGRRSLAAPPTTG